MNGRRTMQALDELVNGTRQPDEERRSERRFYMVYWTLMVAIVGTSLWWILR